MKLRNDQLLALGIVAVIAVTFVFVFFLPQRRQMKEVQREREGACDSLKRDKAKATELAQIRGDVARMSEQLSFFNRRLPDQQELGQFLKDVSNFAQAAGLDAAEFKPQTVEAGELYLRMPISMKFTGDFQGLFRFLRSAKHMTRLTHVRSLEIHNSQALDGRCDVSLVMDIFFTRG